MTEGERLDRLERTVQGIKAGQQALREHIDGKIDALTTAVEKSTSEQPLTAPVWAFLLMAGSTTVFAAVALIFLADYYIF